VGESSVDRMVASVRISHPTEVGRALVTSNLAVIHAGDSGTGPCIGKVSRVELDPGVEDHQHLRTGGDSAPTPIDSRVVIRRRPEIPAAGLDRDRGLFPVGSRRKALEDGLDGLQRSHRGELRTVKLDAHGVGPDRAHPASQFCDRVGNGVRILAREDADVEIVGLRQRLDGIRQGRTSDRRVQLERRVVRLDGQQLRSRADEPHGFRVESNDPRRDRKVTDHRSAARIDALAQLGQRVTVGLPGVELNDEVLEFDLFQPVRRHQFSWEVERRAAQAKRADHRQQDAGPA